MADDYRHLIAGPPPEDIARIARELADGTPIEDVLRPHGRFHGIDLPELRTRPRPSYVVDHYLQADSIAVLEGVDGTYKTFLALAWAQSVALGLPWFEHTVHQGRVLYLLGEGSRGLARRADAWQLVNLKQRDDVPSVLFVVDEMPQLWKGDASAVIAANPGPFVFLVVDTLARAMVGGNENLQQDMGLLVDGCDQMRRAYDGACVLLLHHLNAGGRSRGSTSLPGAVSTRLRLDREGASRVVTLSVNKQRDDEMALPLQLIARTVDLGSTDDRGRPETSLILDLQEGHFSQSGQNQKVTQKVTHLKPSEKSALDALVTLKVTQFSAWAEASGLKKTAFLNARASLIRWGWVAHLPDGTYQVTEQGHQGHFLGHLEKSDPGQERGSLKVGGLLRKPPTSDLPSPTSSGDLPWG